MLTVTARELSVPRESQTRRVTELFRVPLGLMVMVPLLLRVKPLSLGGRTLIKDALATVVVVLSGLRKMMAPSSQLLLLQL